MDLADGLISFLLDLESYLVYEKGSRHYATGSFVGVVIGSIQASLKIM